LLVSIEYELTVTVTTVGFIIFCCSEEQPNLWEWDSVAGNKHPHSSCRSFCRNATDPYHLDTYLWESVPEGCILPKQILERRRNIKITPAFGNEHCSGASDKYRRTPDAKTNRII